MKSLNEPLFISLVSIVCSTLFTPRYDRNCFCAFDARVLLLLFISFFFLSFFFSSPPFFFFLSSFFPSLRSFHPPFLLSLSGSPFGDTLPSKIVGTEITRMYGVSRLFRKQRLTNEIHTRPLIGGRKLIKRM